MGTRGVVPKRKAELRRRNTDGRAVETVKAVGRVSVPVLPKTTHDIARRWYNSLKVSAQSQYFEPSDWAAAYLVAEYITRMLAESNAAIMAKDHAHIAIRGAQFTALWSAMESLLTTEGSRRRMRMEIERTTVEPEAEQPPGILALDAFRREMEG